MLTALSDLACPQAGDLRERISQIDRVRRLGTECFGVYATDEITITFDAYDAHLDVDLDLDPGGVAGRGRLRGRCPAWRPRLVDMSAGSAILARPVRWLRTQGELVEARPASLR